MRSAAVEGRMRSGVALRENPRGAVARVRCPVCHTERDAAAEDCDGCGGVLGVAPLSGGNGDVYELEHGSLSEHAATLPAEAPPSRFREVEEIAAIERRGEAVSAMVPVWGLWRLRRSDGHTLREKVVLGAASLLVTAAIVAGVRALAPTAEERAAATHRRIEQQIDTLRTLVERRRSELGGEVTVEEWLASARQADLRFYDPWGRIYRYESSPEGYRIGTFGEDDASGGEAENADLFRDFRPPPDP